MHELAIEEIKWLHYFLFVSVYLVVPYYRPITFFSFENRISPRDKDTKAIFFKWKLA